MSRAPHLSSQRLVPGLVSLPHTWFADLESAQAAITPTAEIHALRSRVPPAHYYQFLAHLPIQRVHLMGFGSSDLEIMVKGCPAIHLVACFQGLRRVVTPQGTAACGAGGALLLPPGDRLAHGANSNAIFTLQPEAIEQAAAAMAGDRDGPCPRLRRARAFRPRAWPSGPMAQQIHAFLRYVDACAAVDPTLPVRLALDDVVHRLVAVLLDPSLLEALPADRERPGTIAGKSAFADLIDYIRCNLDQPLSLSDLEARSHYSRRALQYAFRQQLDCTPKQWIRQQRLHAAMEKLQAAEGPGEVRAVALPCGYRSLSLFSSDFKRQFGLSPSAVRRHPL